MHGLVPKHYFLHWKDVNKNIGRWGEREEIRILRKIWRMLYETDILILGLDFLDPP